MPEQLRHDPDLDGPLSPFPHVPAGDLLGEDYRERAEARRAALTGDDDRRHIGAQADAFVQMAARQRAELRPDVGETSTASTSSTDQPDPAAVAAFVARMNRERFAR